MVAQLCKDTKTHWNVHFKWLNFLVYKKYLIDILKMKSNTSYNIDIPQNIMLREKSQTQKIPYCMIPYCMKYLG